MTNYRELKKEQEKNKKRLNELNEKADNLQNKSNQITEIIDNLKPSKLNKNNFTISTVCLYLYAHQPVAHHLIFTCIHKCLNQFYTVFIYLIGKFRMPLDS